ncbi:unnamed protein product [Adineta ricciae]|uniref:G-protein coupled receptors family 1 profile domain-containing protein n=1 Tax=Adineta ricciae TaxID=249248 RepID=A0A815F4U1_ADIRI|nr:unnamed protein product [Adineta ricciae]CAF1320262.1 unnamed protein product [Adineta ricciae]
MMTYYKNNNSNTNASVDEHDYRNVFATYYPLFLVIMGTILNVLTYLILYRPIFRDSMRQSTLYYMRAIAIFDILMLYGWNLDHFLYRAYGFMLQTWSIPTCKLGSFLNYFASQVSAWLRVSICFERCLALNWPHKLSSYQSKNVLIIISCIVIVFTLINLHFILFACYFNENGTMNLNARLYQIYPLWDYINLVIYNCVPFILMVSFNSNVIYHLMRFRYVGAIQNARIQHRSISITLIITTFLFLIMTIPATICYAFFYATASRFVLHLFDYILYTYHILSFPIYLITLREFRQEIYSLIVQTRWYRTELLFHYR